MHDSPLDRSYVLVVPRPESVVEWSDVVDWLLERAENLLPAIAPPDHQARLPTASQWTIEPAEYDSELVSVEIRRPLGLDAATQRPIYLEITLGVEATREPHPPESLRLHVSLAEERPFVRPPTTLRDRLQLAAALAGATLASGAIFWLVTRVGHSLGYALVEAAMAFLGSLISLVTLLNRLPDRRRDEAAAALPPLPSAEYLALRDAVAALYPPPSVT